MLSRSSIAIGKSARALSRLRGGGSALPGLIIEKLDPSFLKRSLAQLPYGVVVISGTNGKTTTTKLVAALLQSQGLRVFTNSSGSNFKRGVISSLIEKIDRGGRLPYDIAVLELDEAHGVLFAKEIPPSYTLLLNVMRDQLDRFGEIDTTANMLREIASHTTSGVIVNRDDPRLYALLQDQSIKAPFRTFGIGPKLHSLFTSDDDLYGEQKRSASLIDLEDVILESIDGSRAEIAYGGKTQTVSLKLSGVYNVLNAAAAIALTRLIIGQKLDNSALVKVLEALEPAFGRGEKLVVSGQSLELVLVKNPSGFRLALSSFSADNNATMIAINDNYADGRDMSWLWDVDFASLRKIGVSMVSGIRAYDMALRLYYDEVKADQVETNLAKALNQFLRSNDGPKRIFCTYTAMLALRRELQKYTKLERGL